MFSSLLHSRAPCKAAGFTYLGILIFVAILGIASAATIRVGVLLERRAAEEQLLAIGMEFRNALVSYANATPVGQPRLPNKLEDLLKDPRYPNVRRHLRKIYDDPLTGKPEWGTVTVSGSPGIAGVYSLSESKPIKIGNFEASFRGFEGKESYREWIFGDLQRLVSVSVVPLS
jgi:type II secretory pathway pseudopilin PulG